MANELPDIESFLPFGNSLRELINQSYISAFDLKRILKQRGVFISSSEKEKSIPLLMTVILSPDEFEFLREKQNTKEDNIKTNSFTIEIDEKNIVNTSLLALVPDIGLNTLVNNDERTSNYSVDGQPNFQPVNNQNTHKIELPYATVRNNLTKDWATNKTRHEGSIVIEKIQENDKTLLKVTNTYTSSETKEVGKEFAKTFTNNLKQQNFIAAEVEPRKIRFNDFTNESRIQFLQKLMSDLTKSVVLELNDITNIELSPDKTTQMPDKLSLLEEKIEQIKLKGKDLFNSAFVQETDFHKCLLFSGIEAAYKFKVDNVSGKCSVYFSFNGFSQKQDVWSELEIRLGSMVFDKDSKGASKNAYQSRILDYFEKTKFSFYEQYKNKMLQTVS